MVKIFEDIRLDWQLMKMSGIITKMHKDGTETTYPPQLEAVAIVTNIFYDPVEDKEYVCLAMLRRNGTYGKPTQKRTITGLAREGWKKADKDYIAMAKEIAAKNKLIDKSENVVSIFNRQGGGE